jgi:transposase
MGAPQLPDVLRELVIRWRYRQHMPVDQIAANAACHVSTVYRILSRYELTGNPYALDRGHRARVLDDDDLRYLLAVVRAQPKSYLDELQTRLWTVRGVFVSLSTLCRTLYRLGYSRKAVSREAAERDELLRAVWRAEYCHLPPECMVWLDESGLDDRGHARTEGWAPVGLAPICSEPFARGMRLTMLPAFTMEGIIAMDILDGGVTKERFLAFLRDHLVCALHTHCVVVANLFIEATSSPLAAARPASEQYRGVGQLCYTSRPRSSLPHRGRVRYN